MISHLNVDPHSFRQRLAKLFAIFVIVCNIAGCDNSRHPGQELYGLENPTRSWIVPEIKSIDLDNAARIVIDVTEIDFGMVEPHIQETHVFTVRNDGATPLSLKRVDTNPSITILPKGTVSIPPGEPFTLELGWTPEVSIEKKDVVLVEFRTNDPRQSVLQLKASGQVRSTVLIDPPVLGAPRARPDRPTEMAVLISSQRWKSFDVSDVASSLPGLTWNVVPADIEKLEAISAHSGWVLRAKLPANLPSGEIVDQSISLRVQSHEGEGELRQLEIPIRGKVLRRLAVYGKGMDEKGTIHFGVLPFGVEHKRNFIVKVYDKEPTLTVRDIHVTPEFLDVRLKPYDNASSPKNLYLLTVILPATAPPCVYRVQRFGEIRFEFDHPHITELTLNVDFVLTGEARHVFASLSDVR